MSQEHAERDLALEIVNAKNNVIKQLRITPIWCLVPEQPPLQKGDYVLATRWHDGNPCDPFCIGFYAEKWSSWSSESGDQIRHYVIYGDETSSHGGSFRRAEAITEEEGKALIALIPEIGDKPGRSLWWHLDCIRGVPNPYDPCDEIDND